MNKSIHAMLLVLVAAIWGSTFFIIKDAVQSVNEFFMVFIRTAIAFIALFFFLFKKDKILLLDKNAILYGSILGGLLFISYTSQTIGLKYTSTGHSAFITSSAIIWVPFLCYILYRQRISHIDIFTVITIVMGLFYLTYDTETSINIGDIITNISALSRALILVLVRKMISVANLISIVVYQFLTAAICSLCIWLITCQSVLDINIETGFSLLYLGIFGTLFCYFITTWVQKYVSALKVSIITSTEPLFATIFSFIFINERLNYKELIGAFLILLGVVAHSLLNSIYYNKKICIKKSTNI